MAPGPAAATERVVRLQGGRTVLEEIPYPDPEEWYLNLARMHNDPETMANVASQNTMVDNGVGRLLKALEDNDLDENTLVIYTSDQGNFFGQHGLWGHTDFSFPASLYETAMNIPLIARYPGIIKEGGVSDLFIGQYDRMSSIPIQTPSSNGLLRSIYLCFCCTSVETTRIANEKVH